MVKCKGNREDCASALRTYIPLVSQGQRCVALITDKIMEDRRSKRGGTKITPQLLRCSSYISLLEFLFQIPTLRYKPTRLPRSGILLLGINNTLASLLLPYRFENRNMLKWKYKFQIIPLHPPVSLSNIFELKCNSLCIKLINYSFFTNIAI